MIKTIELPEAIFFDWDGTLVDSFSFLEGAHEHVMRQFAMDVPASGWFRVYFGRPRDEIYAGIYNSRAEEAKKIFEAYVLDNHRKLIKPMPGAVELVEYIYKLGIKSGVVSNKRALFVRGEVEALGWNRHFKTVVGYGDTPYDKPEAGPLLFAMERAEVSGACWYVGDTEMDLLCAYNAKCPSIFIYNDIPQPLLIQKYNVFQSFSRCEQFKEFLLHCQKN